MTYEQATHFAQTWGLLILVILFVGAALYALWPGNKEKFQHAAVRMIHLSKPTRRLILEVLVVHSLIQRVMW